MRYEYGEDMTDCGQRNRAGSAISQSTQKNVSGSTGGDSGDSALFFRKRNENK